MSDLGKYPDQNLLHPRYHHKYIGKTAEYPDTYKMNSSGLFLRESVLDIPQMENLFVTPRAFNYYMTRKSSEEWEAEQKKDGNLLQPFNLHLIEKGVSMQDLTKMIHFESGKADYRKISDIALCTELDELARKRYGKHSVYQLSLKEKQEIAEQLHRVRHLDEAKIRRCLVLTRH